MRSQLSGAAIVLVLLSQAPAYAQEADSQPSRAAWANAGAKLGVTTVQLLASDPEELQIEYPRNENAAESLSDILNNYTVRKERLRSSNLGLTGGAQFLIDGTAAIMVSTGVGIVPAAIVHVAGSSVVDSWRSSLKRDSQIHLEKWLAAQRPQILSATGLSYEQLQSLPPAEIKSRLAETDLFDGLTSTLPNDPDVVQFSQDLVIDGIRNVQAATLDKLAAQGVDLTQAQKDISELSTQFVSFRKETVAVLEEHNAQLESLTAEVSNLQGAVSKIDQRLQVQGRDQAIIADFVFSQMSANEKVSALESGFRAEAFECADGSDSCELAKAKEDLLDRYRSEARIGEISRDIQGAASALGSVSTIATKLGIENPDLAKAANLASIASTAFAQYASGNVLGAVSALSSAFGSQKDPDQARFEAIMRELGIINQKLDAVLANQKKIFEAITSLSEQLAETHQALDQRLERIEFETKRISATVSESAWADWLSCSSLYNEALQSDVYDTSRGRYRSLAGVQQLIGVRPDAARECITQAQNSLLSPAADQYFGNFLSLNRLKDVPDELFVSSSPDDSERYFAKSDLQNYVERVHEPSLILLSRWAQKRGLSWAQIFVRLSFPSTDFMEADAPSVSEYLAARGSRLLRYAGQDQNATAAELLRAPMAPHGAIDVTNWIRAAARIANFRDPSTGDFLTRDELLVAALEGREIGSSGESITKDMVLLLDAAIANHSLKYSVELVLAVQESLSASQSGPGSDTEIARQMAFDLLANNQTLRSNLALLQMREAYGAHSSSPVEINEELVRSGWLEAFEEDEDGGQMVPFERLRGLFGWEVEFSMNDNGQVMWPVAELSGSVLLAPMPSPARISDARLDFPARLAQLVEHRDALIEDTLDYEAIRSAAEDLGARADLVAALADPNSF